MAARTVSLRADPEAPIPGSLRAPRRLRAVTVEPAAAPAGLRASVTQMLRRAAHPALGCACLVVAFGLCLTLASFNPADPSFNVATGAEPRNWLGAPGAHAADLLLQWLGAAAYLPVAPLAMWGALGITGSRVKALRRRVLLILPAVLLAAMALAALPGRGPGGLEAGPGGIGGAAILSGLSTLLDIGPAIPIMPLLAAAAGAGALALLAYAAGWTWTGVAALGLRAGRMIAKPVRWIIKQVWPQRVAHDDGGDEDDEPVARKVPMLHRLWRRLDEVLGKLKRRAAPSRAVVRVEPAFGEIEDEAPPENPDTLPAAQLSAPEPRREPRVARPQAPVKESRRAKAEREPMLDLGKKKAFELPALSLLARPKGPGERESDAALEASARMLESVLADFGVRGAIGAVRPGPVVTLYELEPAAGIKASRVIGLADDIARSMSAVACRVAVVPGRNVIGIELPNRKRDMVFLRELLSANEYENGPAALNLALGKDISGAPVFADLARMPHVLIAGTTGSGKSVGINTMILSLLYRHAPEQCRLIMIDPKMLELSVYEGIPHLLAPVVTEPKKAIVALKWAVREMEDRYRKMAKLGVRNIDGFNERVRKAKAKDEILKRVVQTGFDRETGEPVFEEERLELDVLPFIVVIIDEMADLMIVAGKEIEALVQRLAQMARAAGIHVIMATQRPSVDVITGTIKANFPTRVSFQVTSKIDSRTILGEQGAEQLLGQGDMLFMAGGGRIRRVHGAFVTDDEVIDVVKHLKTQGFPDYVEAVTADPDEDNAMDAALGLDGEGGSGDDLYDQAVAIVKRDGRVSTSYIQRRLQIGYNRAARIIERMEEEGVVTAPNHQGKREILGYEGP